MRKNIFCGFTHNESDDCYCNVFVSGFMNISNEIKSAIDNYFDRLDSHNIDRYKYSRSHKANILNIPVNFDIETTNIKEHKCALCYIWQIAIYDYCFYGRYIEDFPVFLDILSFTVSRYKSKKSRAKNCIIIYVHNLSFEYQNIRKLIKIEPDSVLCYDKRDIIKFDLIHTYETLITFRCSYCLTGVALKKLVTSAGVSKHKSIDYSLMRAPVTDLTHDELDYALDDVYVMSCYFDDMLIRDHVNMADIPLTLTGYAREHFKQLCGFRLSKHDEISPDIAEYRRILSFCKLDNLYELTIARSCFQGGFTHGAIGAFNEIHSNVYHYDLTSSYPTVLLSEMYPLCSFTRDNLKASFIHQNNHDSFLSILDFPVSQIRDRLHLGYIVRVHFKFVRLKRDKNECIISWSKILNNESKEDPVLNERVINGRVHSAENLIMYLTDVDFELYRLFYDCEYEIQDLLFADFGYLPKVFCQTVVDLYYDKTTLKGVEGKESEYSLKKQKLNSIYGLTVTDPIRDNFTYDNDSGELIEKIYSQNDIEEILADYNKSDGGKPSKINYYYWGVFCTAYARSNLIRMIDNLKYDYLYADTDSVFFTNQDNIKYIKEYNADIVTKLLKNPSITYDKIAPQDIKGKVHILGQWTSERFCNMFVTIGAKRYLEVYQSDYKFTCAGIKPEFLKRYFEDQWREYVRKIFQKVPSLSEYKKAKFYFITEGFNDVYNGREYEIANSGKLTTTFNDSEVIGELQDHQGHVYQYDIKSSEYLENTTFTLNMFDFDLFIQGIFEDTKKLKKSGFYEEID